MKKLKELFKTVKTNTSIDHTEWIETNRGDLRLFCPTDYLSNTDGEIQAENANGYVLSLKELTEDEIEMFIDMLNEKIKETIKAKLIEDIKKDIHTDWSILDELLDMLPVKTLLGALDENEWKNYPSVKM